jgi:hypothetical protein
MDYCAEISERIDELTWEQIDDNYKARKRLNEFGIELINNELQVTEKNVPQVILFIKISRNR